MAISPEESRRIFEEVRENHRRLDECEGPHDFVCITTERRLNRTYQCQKCTGKIDSIAHSWYQDGLKHGRGS